MIMKIVESIIALVFVGVLAAYSILRAWTPFWVDVSVIIIVIVFALYAWIAGEK
jgi:hypothetical protein